LVELSWDGNIWVGSGYQTHPKYRWWVCIWSIYLSTLCIKSLIMYISKFGLHKRTIYKSKFVYHLHNFIPSSGFDPSISTSWSKGSCHRHFRRSRSPPRSRRLQRPIFDPTRLSGGYLVVSAQQGSGVHCCNRTAFACWSNGSHRLLSYLGFWPLRLPHLIQGHSGRWPPMRRRWASHCHCLYYAIEFLSCVIVNLLRCFNW
jgi:hypothetical protein